MFRSICFQFSGIHSQFSIPLKIIRRTKALRSVKSPNTKYNVDVFFLKKNRNRSFLPVSLQFLFVFKVTFGIHSGEVVGGVIGQRMPRYCLFGNAVNLTSRTETTGVKGKINVTEETYK